MLDKIKSYIEDKALLPQAILLVLVAFVAWSGSITDQFVGYDDVKLIVSNDRIHKGIWYTLKFYFNVVSDSHNVCWTNYPTVIFRPLEWFGSSIGYKIWKDTAEFYHLFFNIHYHLWNSIIVFLMLTFMFGGKLRQVQIEEENYSSKSQAPTVKTFKDKEAKTSSNETKYSLSIANWAPLIITLIWTVHPLHNEAVNMLTSGVGFLWASLLCFIGLYLNVTKIKDLTKPLDIFFMALAWFFTFAGYHGAEMTVIAPIVLWILFYLRINGESEQRTGYEWLQVAIMASTWLVYFTHRENLITEHSAWLANGMGEFLERVFVLAPQIFFHYVKLFVFPAKLTIDQHHNVYLANAFSPYHLLALGSSFYYAYICLKHLFDKDQEYKSHNRVIGTSMFLAIFSIAMSLNIIPLYCLARERYCYFFALGLLVAIIVGLDKYIFSRKKLEDIDFRPWLILLAIIVSAFSVRSWARSREWRNGEVFWNQTMDSVDDIGAKQNWRYRLMQYYKNPGTKDFEANPQIKAQTFKDFDSFAKDYQLDKAVSKIRTEEKQAQNYLSYKYGYAGSKTIASGLFFNATDAITKKDGRSAMNYFRLAHAYYKEHFQNNLQMFIHTHGQDDKFEEYILKIMKQEAHNNTFLAKGLMDAMFFLKHPRMYEFASYFREKFPTSQVFDVYFFNAAYRDKKYREAYLAAKRIVRKYHEQDVFEKYIQKFEEAQAGAYQKKLKLPGQTSDQSQSSNKTG